MKIPKRLFKVEFDKQKRSMRSRIKQRRRAMTITRKIEKKISKLLTES